MDIPGSYRAGFRLTVHDACACLAHRVIAAIRDASTGALRQPIRLLCAAALKSVSN